MTRRLASELACLALADDDVAMSIGSGVVPPGLAALVVEAP